MRHKLIRTGLLLALSYGGVGGALAQECSDAHFKGRYAFEAEFENVFLNTRSSVVGTMFSDGKGTITEWKQTNVIVAPGTEGTIVEPRDFSAFSLTYTVSPDCQMTIRADAGVFAIEGVGALANDGREVFFTQTVPNGVRGGGVLKSITPSLSDKLDSIMRRLGVFWVPDDDD